ncbi:MAG TPA: M12 family metallo-peptidase [Saprospiraceae bacterium]|nr:M12 family metallo-peptidase [Saprospiraceae bacterium]
MKYISTLLLLVLNTCLFAQPLLNFWKPTAEDQIVRELGTKPDFELRHYRTLGIDLQALRASLRQAPMEFSAAARTAPLLLQMPLPDGGSELMEVVESPVMEAELAAQYPDIRTYKAISTKDRRITGRFDVSPDHFHAIINKNGRTAYIDPYLREQGAYYISYFDDDVQLADDISLSCGVTHTEAAPNYEETTNSIDFRDPLGVLNMRRYRMAIATTSAYGTLHGNTKETVLASLVTAVNRLSEIYERDIAARFVLINGNDNFIYLDPNNEPFTNLTNGGNLLGQSTNVFGNIMMLPFTAYDIGHVFTGRCTDVGGVANLAALCSPARMRGVTCHSSSNVLSVAASVFAHEVGHQFSANHTFSEGCSPQNIASGTAFEPGCGHTIMSYGGAGRIAFFHISSIDEMISYTRNSRGNDCATFLPEGNNEPELTLPYQNGFFIPINTPFELTADAFDVENDPITYSWEQFDNGTIVENRHPLFRSFAPVPTPTRIFPAVNFLVSNQDSPGESLPDVSRDLTFRCTVRDNNPAAPATVWREVRFKSTDTAGPFLVTYPNADGIKLQGGSYAEIQWDVANTDRLPVNCQAVNIRLSTDEGFTYPILLAERVANTGSALVGIPDLATNRARIRVEAAGNIFFDISNRNFEIERATEPTFLLNAFPRAVMQHCLPDPIELSIQPTAILGYDSLLTLALAGNLPEDAEVNFSATEVLPGEAVSIRINFSTQVESTFDLELIATSPGGVKSALPIQISTISNDFSGLKMLAPAEGSNGIEFSTAFRWNRVNNARSYDIEVATSPTFGNTIVASRYNTLDTTFTPVNFFFDSNRLYYWRIRPRNSCGPANFLEPQVFHTVNSQCEDTRVTNVPVNISGTGLPTVNSTINVLQQGTITDVNLPFVKISYQPVKSLRVTLISPAGTEEILYDQNCGNTVRFETGFDDESPLAISCPPDRRLVTRPVQPLSRLIGENTAGLWTLRVRVMTPGFGGGGAIEDWRIEFCSDVNPEDPFLVRNELLFVPLGQVNTLTSNELEVQDPNNTPLELTYTLVTLPRHGTLTRSGAPVEVGQTFTQQDINNFQMKYAHSGDGSLSDSFLFVVQDGTGGFLPTQRFRIGIDENAPVRTSDLLMDATVRIFPNPTRDLLYVHFDQPLRGALWMSVYNVQGQEILRQRYDQPDNQVQISTDRLPNGMYFLVLRNNETMLSRKISVQK